MSEIELKKKGKIKRLTNKTFRFDPRLGEGYYTAAYFLKTVQISEQHLPTRRVTIQFFTRKAGIICGLDEVIAMVFKYGRHPERLVVEALADGMEIEPLEPVLRITGNYADFGFLENVIDGVLARRTSVATNTKMMVEAVKPARLIFMGDRDDGYENQPGDGYAAYIGGATLQVTNAHGKWWDGVGMGTMPHALIQMCKGDLVQACRLYHKTFPDEPIVALVDYHNDVITDSLKVARVFGKKLKGVRIDTSISLTDRYFETNPDHGLPAAEICGVNPHLVKALRQALDQEGFNHVEIIVSSGFNLEKVAWFKREGAPVDAYGVGRNLLNPTHGFTGDLVLLDGNPEAKTGRSFTPSNRLERVKYQLN